jgi:hypothetical protein
VLRAKSRRMSGEITLEGDSTPVQAPMGFSSWI